MQNCIEIIHGPATAKTTARILFDDFIVHYGFPCKLHSDMAQNFESKVIQHLCKAGGIKKTRTTPYHPTGKWAGRVIQPDFAANVGNFGKFKVK